MLLAASIIRVTSEAGRTSETSVNFYQTILRNNPKYSHLLNYYFFKNNCRKKKVSGLILYHTGVDQPWIASIREDETN
jgi:hypothetical protein